MIHLFVFIARTNNGNCRRASICSADVVDNVETVPHRLFGNILPETSISQQALSFIPSLSMSVFAELSIANPLRLRFSLTIFFSIPLLTEDCHFGLLTIGDSIFHLQLLFHPLFLPTTNSVKLNRTKNDIDQNMLSYFIRAVVSSVFPSFLSLRQCEWASENGKLTRKREVKRIVKNGS